MVTQILLRVLSGVVFAGVGYLIGSRLLINTILFNDLYFVPLSLAFILGVVGVFLIPLVSSLLQRFFFNFVRLLAKELVRQSPLRRLTHPEKVAIQTIEYKNPMILDTSAIIDGRIAEIAKTGFLDGTIVIPRFILGELQHIADSSDPLRRGRGRRGFEVIEELKNAPGLKLDISDLDFPEVKKADDKLVQMGKKLKAKVITTDYNLNKVASISGVKILNVNELANSIKTILIPGEEIQVKVIQEGKEKDQGVGYLPDGTMIVVEGGEKLIGKTVEAEVSRVFQTAAGRMIFTKQK